MIVIIDYNVGNLSAVSNMLKRCGYVAKISNNPVDIDQASHLILPGTGSFDACVEQLHQTKLLPIIEEKVFSKKTPILGICVGAQMLGKCSEEGRLSGLGWIGMTVKRFADRPSLRIPHMGWNTVEVASNLHPITNGLGPDSRFYFVHSYYLDPVSPDVAIMYSQYPDRFAAAVAKENIIGVQFHPEKSHRFGKVLLDNFGKLNG